MVDTSTDSLGLQLMKDRKVLRGNLGTAVDSLSLGMSSPHIQGLQEDQDKQLFTLSPVKVRNTR